MVKNDGVGYIYKCHNNSVLYFFSSCVCVRVFNRLCFTWSECNIWPALFLLVVESPEISSYTIDVGICSSALVIVLHVGQSCDLCAFDWLVPVALTKKK